MKKTRKHFYLTVLPALLCLVSYSQTNDKSLEYFNSANDAVAKKQFPLADSLYSLSLELTKHHDTYYNRAQVRKQLNNMKGYCDDLHSAAEVNDTIAQKEFWKNCGKKDTIYYDRFKNTATKYDYAFRETTSKCFYTSNYSYEKINSEKKLLVSYKAIDNDTIFYGGSEMEMPSFKGGDMAMMKYIQKNVNYTRGGVSGTVYVTFVVNQQGKIKNVSLLRGVKGGEDLDKEAMRVISSMPNWTPGTYNGRTHTGTVQSAN